MKFYHKLNSLSTQRSIGLAGCLITLLIGVFNLLNLIFNNNYNNTFSQAIYNPAVFILIFSSIILFFSSLKERYIYKILHLFTIFLIGTLSILDNYDSLNGVCLFVLFIILLRHYEVFTKIYIIVPANLLYVFILIIISSSSNKNISLVTALNHVLYLLVFSIVLYVIYRNKINKMMSDMYSSIKNSPIYFLLSDFRLSLDKVTQDTRDIEKKLFDLLDTKTISQDDLITLNTYIFLVKKALTNMAYKVDNIDITQNLHSNKVNLYKTINCINELIYEKYKNNVLYKNNLPIKDLLITYDAEDTLSLLYSIISDVYLNLEKDKPLLNHHNNHIEFDFIEKDNKVYIEIRYLYREKLINIKKYKELLYKLNILAYTEVKNNIHIIQIEFNLE